MMERGLTCLVLKMSESLISGVTYYHSTFLYIILTGSLGSSIFHYKNDMMKKSKIEANVIIVQCGDM